MALKGILSSEVEVHASAFKWFKLFSKELHNVQNTTDRVHKTKLLQGDDWHSIGSVKQWTDIVDGKQSHYKERLDAIDERNKTITYTLFDGDFNKNYNVFKLLFQVIEKGNNVFIKWTIDYEKMNENVEPPYDFMDHLTKSTKEIDAFLLKA
ncbi:putative START-like domain-containing protein [Lupinus albus]|uniref:Putative START-like domain-containing protein n=1 Tax=Lupinus albus TaxID=3870 RepID=A0A6A4NNJ9_LUPAL|nr:putative START-like domain-containing protein [Lupinus albus]